MSTWYWKTAEDSEPRGPISAKELKTLALSNRLSRGDFVWKQGMQAWVQANKLKGLFDAPGPQALDQSENNHTSQSAVEQISTANKSVHHSTGMYQKSSQHLNNGHVGSAGSDSTAGYLDNSASLRDSLKGMDYNVTPGFFSYDGRIRRTTYLLHSLAISFGFIILVMAIVFGSGNLMEGNWVGAIIMLVLLSIGVAVGLSFPTVKRLHDLDLNGWFYLISFIPYINLPFSLYILFARGTVGPNKYGQDPR